MGDFTIREFTPQTSSADLERLLPAFLSIWNHPDHLPFLSPSLRPFEEAQVRSWLASHLDQSGRYFVALDPGERILGISLIKTDPVIGFELMALGVTRDARRRGVGRGLVAYSERVAADEAYHAVQVSVFADNPAMLCLLLTLGYLPIRLDPHVRADFMDMLTLRKRLV